MKWLRVWLPTGPELFWLWDEATDHDAIQVARDNRGVMWQWEDASCTPSSSSSEPLSARALLFW